MNIGWWVLIAAAVIGWAGLVWMSWYFDRVRLRDRDEFLIRLMHLIAFVWSHGLHRLEIKGQEHIPDRTWDTHPVGTRRNPHGEPPLIVIPNHTAGIDPVLVQVACPFEIRWMMAADMRMGALEWAWQHLRIIFVDRDKQDSSSIREALRHLKAGGTLGLFPEGHLERPPRTLLPFKEGIGLLVKKTNAIVLPVVITGTPQIDPAWGSLLRPSRSVVRFLEPVQYADDWSADAIREDLRARFKDVTGWPDAPHEPQKVDGRLYCFGVDGRYHAADRWNAPVDPRLQSELLASNERSEDAEPIT